MAVALLVPRPLGGERDAPFLRVLTTAMSIDLARAGLEARVPEDSLLLVLADAPLKRLLEQAAGADFLILAGYASSGQTIRLEVEVLQVQGGQRIASASASRRIDLRLDEVTGAVVQQLLPPMEPYLAQARERQQIARAAEGSLADAPVPGKPEPLPAAEDAAEAGVRPERRRERERYLEVGAGGATFFPMAALDPLFRLGYLAELYLDYRVRRSAASLAFGVYTGYTGLLPAEPGTASYFESLIPVGLSLRLSTPQRSRLGVHARIQAGAALNVSAQDKVDQRLTRVLPQVKAGAGVSLAITRRLGLSLDFVYELLLYMYQQDGTMQVEPIMGFNVPAVFFYMRL